MLAPNNLILLHDYLVSSYHPNLNCSRCPVDESTAAGTELQPIGEVVVRKNPFMQQKPNSCSSQSYQVWLSPEQPTFLHILQFSQSTPASTEIAAHWPGGGEGQPLSCSRSPIRVRRRGFQVHMLPEQPIFLHICKVCGHCCRSSSRHAETCALAS